MKRILTIELHRAFTSHGFFLSLLLGTVIAVSHCATSIVPLALGLDEYLSYNMPMMYPGWLFTSWMGGNAQNMLAYLFFLIIPLLAALPFADSFFSDAKGGFIQSLCIRTNKHYYFAAKYTACFLSGGTAVILPLALNFGLSCMLLPSMKPEVTAFDSAIGENSSFPHLFYEHPFVYVLVYLAFIFVFSGLIATLSLLASYHVSHRFLVVIAPFFIFLFVNALFSLWGLEQWEPVNFLHPSYAGDARIPMLVETVLLCGLTGYAFIVKGAQDDVF